MSRLLILSPHLDDAVLSCGARIAQTVVSGGEVMVVTCFTSPGEEATTDLRERYEQRRADDSAALGLLGAQFRHLGFVDAPFRNAAYYNFNTILFHHRLGDEEKLLIRSLGDVLRQLTEEWKPDETMFPLGIGGHIDHHLVWESSKVFWEGILPDSPGVLNERGAIGTISYYEDLPYALIPGWSAVRWNELGGNRPLEGETSDAEPPLRHKLSGESKMNLLEVPYPFVQNYMSSAEDRLCSTAHYNREYARLGNGLWDGGQWTITGHVFIRNLYRIEARYLGSKSRAITGYHSEWPLLFGADERNIPDMLAGATNAAFYTEISWTLKTR